MNKEEVIPIFSLVVLSYNQSDIILNCLNSILLQDNIIAKVELIISDDASTDGTPEIIEKWIKNNTHLFLKVVFLKQPINLGISENHKQAISNAIGQIIKYIGGDDILLPGIINSFITFFDENPQADIVCSDLLVLSDDNKSLRFNSLRPKKENMAYFDYSAKKQFIQLAYNNFVPAPGLCFRQNIIKQDCFFESNLKRFEDWPTWLDITRKGFKIYRLQTLGIIWRRHNKAISNNPFLKKDLVFYENQLLTIQKYILPYVDDNNYLLRWDLYVRIKQLKIILNGNFDKNVKLKVFLLNLTRLTFIKNKLF